MASFQEAYKILVKAEYSNKDYLFLHKNEFEDGFTIGGVYRKYHEDDIDWSFVERVYKMTKCDIKQTSILLFNDVKIQSQVCNVFKRDYWNNNNLFAVRSQTIAEEIFLFGVNAGNRQAAKIAQSIAGVKQDGILGKITVYALNKTDEQYFSDAFDILEVDYYNNIIDDNPKMAINKNGWIKRSKIV